MEVAGWKEEDLICFLNQCVKIQYLLDPAFAESLKWGRGATDLPPNSCQKSNFYPFFLCQFFSLVHHFFSSSPVFFISICPQTVLFACCKIDASIANLLLKFLFSPSLYIILSHIKQTWGNLPASRQDCFCWDDLSNLLLKLFRDGDFTTALGNSMA